MNAALELADKYRADHGMPAVELADVVTDQLAPEQDRRAWVAAYLATDPATITAEARASYAALADEIRAQWAHLEAHGFTWSVSDVDPYVTSSGAPNSLAMRRDVLGNRHITVLSTAVTGSHPYFTDAENDLFRAVHDVFGHAATEQNFSALGEEVAYRHHRTMFSDAALPALTTETRVQNALNNLNGNAFVEQRATIIPGSWA